MSRTREIEVYVHPDDLNDYGHFSVIGCRYEGPSRNETLKAKLIIELPERKVTISESEFDDLWYKSAIAETFSVHQSYMEFKKAIFKDAE